MKQTFETIFLESGIDFYKPLKLPILETLGLQNA